MPHQIIDPEKLFVSTQWLADHLDAPDLVVFDASWHMPAAGRDARAEYLSGHIPGAVFFDIDAVADAKTDLPHMLPDPIAFSAAMRDLGLGDGMRAVIYDSLGLFSAPRLWWTLRAFGVRRRGDPRRRPAAMDRGGAQAPAARDAAPKGPFHGEARSHARRRRPRREEGAGQQIGASRRRALGGAV